jgi:hypothetical protein
MKIINYAINFKTNSQAKSYPLVVKWGPNASLDSTRLENGLMSYFDVILRILVSKEMLGAKVSYLYFQFGLRSCFK